MHDACSYVPWLSHPYIMWRDVTRSYMWYDSFSIVTYICVTIRDYVWRDSFWRDFMVSWLYGPIYTSDILYVIWLILTCDIHMWLCVAWLVLTCDVPRSYMWYDSFSSLTYICDHMWLYVAWLTLTCDVRIYLTGWRRDVGSLIFRSFSAQEPLN